MFLHGFADVAPEFSATQEESLRWLSWIHARTDLSRSESSFAKLFARYGCSPLKIAARFYEFPLYCTYTGEAETRFASFPVSDRMHFFEKVADQRLEAFYREKDAAPGLLVHVSCTGYVSPSAAQKIVVQKKWEKKTAVLHAYHMGCYAALPAVRHAADFVSVHGKSADIFHSELCTLHLNPRDISPEQLVVQSLFADGHIGYSVERERPDADAFEILSVREEIIPGSLDAMKWRVGEEGFQMTLAREVPELIQASMESFLHSLCEQAEVKRSDLQDAIFAIHPGGPRIIDILSDTLRLQPFQTAPARQVLNERGNMSSATLPHIWQKILRSRDVAAGKLILSLAFGPGLTIFGSLMKVNRAC